MKRLFHNFLNLLFPFKCIKCKTFIYNDAVFCHECWKAIEFISEPCCEICSHPLQFSFNVPKHLQICASCHKDKPLFDKLITVFKYTEDIKTVILNFKYNDKTLLAKPFSKLITTRLISAQQQDFDMITSVPLHKKKLRQRMYNQASLIAKNIAVNIKAPFIPNLLIRSKYDPSQTTYTKKMRIKNIRGAFAINKKYLESIKGKKILLVDDVITTGATINECCKILKQGNCSSITAVTIAKRVL